MVLQVAIVAQFARMEKTGRRLLFEPGVREAEMSMEMNAMKLTTEPNRCECDCMSDPYISRGPFGDGGRMPSR